MGGKTESQVKQTVKNRIDATVKNETKNITNVINESTTSITNNMVNEAAATIEIGTNAGNDAEIGTIIAKGGSSVNIEQNAKVEAQNKAIIKIVMSAESMTKLGNDVIADVTNKSKSDASAKASMEALNAIGEKTKKAGGPEQMLDSVTKMVGDTLKGMTQSLTGGSSSSINETDIENSVKTQLINETYNENNIKNSISTVISNSMKQAAEAKCNLNTSATNKLKIADILAMDQGKVNVKQDVSVKAFNDCFIDLNMGNKVSDALTNGYKVESVSETTSTAKSDQEQKTKTDAAKETVQESAVMNSVDNLVNTAGSVFTGSFMIIGGVILAVILVVGGLFGSGALKISDFTGLPGGSDDDEQEGGGLMGIDGKIYLYSGIIALTIMVGRKSLPICGALLIVMIAYVMHKSNPKLFN